MHMLTITLKQLETFVAVAESNSFRQASQKLNLSQSTVTSHIQHLERELGVPVFHRTTRAIRLTEAGRTLLSRATQTIEGLEGIVANFREEASVEHGDIRIVSAPSFACSIFPDLLANFHARYPKVTVRFREAFAHDILEAVRREEADFGIGPMVDGQPQDFEFQFLMKDEFCAVMSKNNVLAGQKTVEFREIAEQPILAMPLASAIRKKLVAVFVSMGLELRPKYEMLHHQTLVAMAAANLGIAILPRIALSSIGAQGVHIARLMKPQLSRDIGIFILRGHFPSPAASAFVKATQEALKVTRPEPLSIQR